MRLMILILTSLFLSAPGFGEGISKEYIQKSIEKAAKDVGVPATLLSAVCWAESNHKPKDFAHEDGSGNNHAFGMCQVLYETAKQFGFKKDPKCHRDFRKFPEEKNYKGCALFGPYTSAFYAAKYLKHQLDRYEGSWISAIAAYNSGTVKTCSRGWVYYKGKPFYKCKIGGLLNQKYVDRVLHALEEGR